MSQRPSSTGAQRCFEVTPLSIAPRDTGTSGASKEAEGSCLRLAYVDQPRSDAISPAWRSAPDRNEEQDSGLPRTSAEGDKEKDRFARIR
jgi:hypothetical protein